jgi:hypothetical protein
MHYPAFPENTLMAASPFQTLSLSAVRDDLAALYRLVSKHQGRVEITGDDGQSECVLISKTELDGLERALSILSDSQAVLDLTQSLSDLAQLAEPAGVVA